MKKSIFYGYVIVIIFFVIQLVMCGPRSSYGVFIKPLTTDFEWTRALVAGAFSLSSVFQACSSIIMGWLNDRLGPRLVMTIAGILVGTGFLLIYFVDSAWQLYLFYGLLIGPGMGGMVAPQMSTVARWFVKRRNIMTAILMAGGGIGGLITPLVINWVIYTYNWRIAFVCIGASVFLLVVITTQFLKRDPSKIGQSPYGEENNSPVKTSSNSSGISLKQALKTKMFWIFALAIFCCGFCYMTIVVHLVPDAIDRGIDPSAAAIVLSVLNGAVPAGSIIAGIIADKIGARKIFLACVSLLFIVAFFLLPVKSAFLLGLFGVILSFGHGGLSVIESSLIADFFGMKSHGAILGCIVFCFILGGAAGPFIGGAVFDSTGSYRWIFLICGILVVSAITMVIYLTRMKKAQT